MVFSNHSIIAIFVIFITIGKAEKCTYTVPTNGYTTTYETDCTSNSNTGGSGTNVPTQSQVYYDPTYYNNNNNNANFNTVGPSSNTMYYTDSNGMTYQYSNSYSNNNQNCICGTTNCNCGSNIYNNPSSSNSASTIYYYYPTNGNGLTTYYYNPSGTSGSYSSSGCSGNDCLVYYILSKKR